MHPSPCESTVTRKTYPNLSRLKNPNMSKSFMACSFRKRFLENTCSHLYLEKSGRGSQWIEIGTWFAQENHHDTFKSYMNTHESFDMWALTCTWRLLTCVTFSNSNEFLSGSSVLGWHLIEATERATWLHIGSNKMTHASAANGYNPSAHSVLNPLVPVVCPGGLSRREAKNSEWGWRRMRCHLVLKCSWPAI